MDHYDSWVQSIQSLVYDNLQAAVEKNWTSTPLFEALGYVLTHPGRAVRPQIVFASHEAIGPSKESPLALASAIELIHISSLIYDDLPCMDNSPLRRGQPTTHRVFGEAIAILAADSLKSLAFEQLGKINEEFCGRPLIDFITTLSRSSGCTGICLGQAIDLMEYDEKLTEEKIFEMYDLKTGSLISAAVLLGAWSHPHVSEEAVAALLRYAKNFGIAFQIINDLNDSSSVDQTGKIPKQDEQQAKKILLVHRKRSDCAGIAAALIAQSRREINIFSEGCTHLGQILVWLEQQIPGDCCLAGSTFTN